MMWCEEGSGGGGGGMGECTASYVLQMSGCLESVYIHI